MKCNSPKENPRAPSPARETGASTRRWPRARGKRTTRATEMPTATETPKREVNGETGSARVSLRFERHLVNGEKLVDRGLRVRSLLARRRDVPGP